MTTEVPILTTSDVVIVAYLDQAITIRWIKHGGSVVLEEQITYLDPARTLEGKRVET